MKPTEVGLLGITRYAEKEICISRDDPSPVATLAHELVHLRWPVFRHGREFERRMAESCALLGLRPSIHWLKEPHKLSKRELRKRFEILEDVAELVREDLKD
jgi:hypothetical protein